MAGAERRASKDKHSVACESEASRRFAAHSARMRSTAQHTRQLVAAMAVYQHCARPS